MPDRLKNLANDNLLQSEQLWDLGEEVTALFASADGRFAIAGTESGKVYFYNLKRGTQIGQSSGGRREITAVGISANGRVAACGNDDGNVVLFDLGTRGVRAHQLKQQDDDIEGIAFSPSGSVLYVLDYDGLVIRYNTKTRAKVGTTKTGVSKPKSMALDRAGKQLAVGGVDSKIALFDATRMVRRKMLQGPGDDQIQRVSFSQDGKYLIAGSIQDDVAIWNLTRLTVKSTRKLKGLSEWVKGVGFSQDGKRACAFDNEFRIVVWDARNARELKKLKFSKIQGSKDLVPISGFVGADGTILIGTDEGEIIHLTLKSVK
jgi:WD40 repeat protein